MARTVEQVRALSQRLRYEATLPDTDYVGSSFADDLIEAADALDAFAATWERLAVVALPLSGEAIAERRAILALRPVAPGQRQER